MFVIILLSGLGLLTLFAGFLKSGKIILPLTIFGLFFTFLINLIYKNHPWNTLASLFNNMMLYDNYAFIFTSLMIISTVLIVLFFSQHHEITEVPHSEIFTLMIFVLIGGVLMVSYNNLVMLFLGIEILSLSIYILVGSKKSDLLSNEATLKYFLMGSFASGLLLFGIVLLYGASGSFHLSGIADYVQKNQENIPSIFHAGILLILMALAFKVSAFPFHFWTPDVYQGSPTFITAFMATIVKTAAIASFFRLFYVCFIHLSEFWSASLWLIIALTISIGNITALYQTSFKRMLAYSSISHAGYVLLAILAMSENSDSSIFYYLVGYSLAVISAFTILIILLKHLRSDDIDSFKGLAKNNPFLAVVMTIAMSSLIGLPPTAGFFGKLYIFSTAMNEGYIGILVIALINSAIGAYYYLRVVGFMFKTTEENSVLQITLLEKVLLSLISTATLLLGLFPNWITELL